MALTRLAHQLVRQHFNDQQNLDVAIDATCGNGHDTEFLARLGFTKVLGFDIQDSAIKTTNERLQQAQLHNVQLIKDGHQHLGQYCDSDIDCAMFNFGYLPHADKSLTTEATTSLQALEASLTLLKDNGLVCLICYPGHPQGAIETQAIQDWLNSLSPQWVVTQHLSNSPKPEAPVLYTITKTPTS